MNEPHRGGHGYYGYRFNDKTKKYEIYPEEAIVIQLIALMMAAGYSLIDIAATLNLLQVKRSDKNNKPIDGKWIRRQFGFYTRYNKDNPKQVEPHYEKYNGKNSFPCVLGQKVYCIISDYFQDLNDGKNYSKRQISFAKQLTFEEDRMERRKIVINDIKKAVPIHATVRIAAKRKKDNK